MLSVEDIIQEICPIQESLLIKQEVNEDFILDKSKRIFDKINYLFDREMFIYDKYETKNNLTNYLISILSILDSTFILKERKHKYQIINELVKKMIIDYDNCNLYYIYNYNKNKKIKKTTIPSYLHEHLNNKNILNIEVLQQFISDYFSINVYIISNENSENNINFIYTKQYNNIINKYVPTIILYKKNDIYYSIFNREITKSIILYSESKKLLEKLYNNGNIFIEEYKYNKMTLKELKDYLLSQDISIKKISELSGKEIYLKKTELLDIIRLRYKF